MDALLKDNPTKNQDDIWRLLHDTCAIVPAPVPASVPASVPVPVPASALSWEDLYQQLKKYRLAAQNGEAMELYTTLDKTDTKYLDYAWQIEYEYSVFSYYIYTGSVYAQ